MESIRCCWFGKEVQGKKDFAVVHDGFQYLFSSAATKSEFQQNPARYEIQMHGLCARMGKATGANPSDYVVYEGKIYIFGSDECHRRFQENPKKYLATPAPPLDGSTKAVSEGKALLQRALGAVGGAAKVEAITTYVETASQVQQRPAGPVPLTTKTMWRFPGDVRLERTVTLPDRAMSSATLMTPAGMCTSRKVTRIRHWRPGGQACSSITAVRSCRSFTGEAIARSRPPRSGNAWLKD